MVPLSELFALPPSVLLPIPLFAFFNLIYFLTAPYFGTEKQRAYILSTFSSATMALVSLPFVWTYLVSGLRVSYEEGQEGWLRLLGIFGVVFFGTYLFADLAIGFLKYPSQVGLVTGWIHHACYIGLMVYLLNSRYSPLFLMAAVMEIPTFDLAISHLFPRVRNDFRFLVSFFLLRILLHAAYLIDCIRPSSRTVTDDSWIPTVMLALAGILHVSWFRGGVSGYIKRQRATKQGRVAEKTTDEPLVDAAVKVDPTVLSTLPSPMLTAATPDDSPLITPYTPSQTPMSLRDSYIFPTITMPTMPNLPTMSIPTIPTLSDISAAFPKSLHADNLNFGFKDAVRTRWDEGRGKFAGLSNTRRGMALNLGGLGLRRRGAAANVAEDDVRMTVKEVPEE